MVNVALGYYTRDAGQDSSHFLMTAEPPSGQYVLRDGVWVPLPDPFYLMGLIISGDVDMVGPMPDPPAEARGSLLPVG
jgi:hypothetical protein